MQFKQPNITLCELGETSIPGLQSYSPFCLKVHRALIVAGLRYDSRHGRPNSFGTAAGQVPVLIVDGAVITDSTRILERVHAISIETGGPALVPANAAEAWHWEEFADRALNGYLVAARWADPNNWPLVREAYFAGAPWPVRRMVAPWIRRGVLKSLVARDVTRSGAEALWHDFRRALDLLEARAPRQGFWVGAEVSVADFGLFGQLHSLRTPLTAAQRDEVERRPTLTAYLDRVDAATTAARPTLALAA